MITIEQVNTLMNTAAYWVVAGTGAWVAYESFKKKFNSTTRLKKNLATVAF